MQMPAFIDRLFKLYRLSMAALKLPVAQLRFHRHIDPERIPVLYSHFNRRHPRYKVIRNKTVGMALIDLAGFAQPNAYLDTVRQRGFAGPQSRKARSRGYGLRRINRNDHIDAIHAIHMSEQTRQGRPLDSAYLTRKRHYDDPAHFACYGAFDSSGTLVAYCNVGFFGNFAATDQLMGYKNGDGVMYLLLLEIICEQIRARRIDYFMYDTYLGAKPGLRDFKRRVGFAPYRVRYALA